MHALSRILNCLVLSALALCAHPVAAAQNDCGDPRVDANNPLDYRTATKSQRNVVERRHFTDDVRSLRRGTSTSDVGADIQYTLNRIPNHFPALLTMASWSMKTGKNPPPNVRHTVECWFARAMLFRPDDGMVKVAYGVYLIKKKEPEEAIKQFEVAIAQGETGVNTYYNLGLAYLDAGQFDKSLESAHRAYALGFPLPGLRDRLKRAGKWRDPAPEATAAAPAAPATAAVAGAEATDAEPPAAAEPAAAVVEPASGASAQ